MLVVLIEQCGGLAIASLRMNLYDAFAERNGPASKRESQ